MLSYLAVFPRLALCNVEETTNLVLTARNGVIVFATLKGGMGSDLQSVSRIYVCGCRVRFK